MLQRLLITHAYVRGTTKEISGRSSMHGLAIHQGSRKSSSFRTQMQSCISKPVHATASPARCTGLPGACCSPRFGCHSCHAAAAGGRAAAQVPARLPPAHCLSSFAARTSRAQGERVAFRRHVAAASAA
eukprot:6192286-Pleurochrysis_carterae.AAC.1